MPLVAKSTSKNFILESDSNIDRDDPEKLFTDLTEIGHGNFGAVYYVNILILLLHSSLKSPLFIVQQWFTQECFYIE